MPGNYIILNSPVHGIVYCANNNSVDTAQINGVDFKPRVTFRTVQLEDPSDMEKMFECRQFVQTRLQQGWLSWPSLPAVLWDNGPCRKPEHQ